MAQQTIGVGSAANDATGDPLRTAYSKINDMMAEIYAFYTKTPINAQTGTSYTPVLGDAGKLITLDNAGAIAVTIPANASVAYDVGTSLKFAGIGVGAVTITGDTGVSINGSSGGSVAIDGQWGGVELTKLGTNSWLAIGKLA